MSERGALVICVGLAAALVIAALAACTRHVAAQDDAATVIKARKMTVRFEGYGTRDYYEFEPVHGVVCYTTVRNGNDSLSCVH